MSDDLNESASKGEVQKIRWWHSWGVYLRPEAMRMLFLGFSAGLPLVLFGSTLAFRLGQADIKLSTIGFASWIGLFTAFKWIWAPFVDRLSIPFLTRKMGRRRSWMFVAQLAIISGLVGMAFADVQNSVSAVIWCAILVSFGSATQDIALDAYRIESAELKMQGALAATYTAGYRLAMIWAGAGALWIVGFMRQMPAGTYDAQAWQVSYLIMAASALVGVFTVLLSPEAKGSLAAAILQQEERIARAGLPLVRRLVLWVESSVIAPFVDFIQRYQKQALIILALIAVYRISDVVMGTVSSPFYHYMGYTESEVASVSKVFGVIMTLVGAFIGGAFIMRLGVFRVLLLGAILSAATNILFALLATYGYGNDLAYLGVSVQFGSFDITLRGKVIALAGVISLDNLSGGIASAAFVGYLSSLTSVQFSATQYALFSSLMQLIPKFVGGFSGVFVEQTNYSTFFICTAVLGLPAVYLVRVAERYHKEASRERRLKSAA